MQRELHTARLMLRPPRASDAPCAQARWGADPAVWRHLDGSPSPDEATMARRLAWDEARWLKRSAFTWLLINRDDRADATDAAPIGLLQLTPQQLDGPAHHLRLGYLLAPAWQGRGLMHEALTTVITHAFTQPDIWRIDAVCDIAQTASCRLLDRAGFTREGLLRRWGRHANLSAEPRDCWLYGRVRDQGIRS